MDTNKIKIAIGNDEMIFECGKIAKQANGAVTAKIGGTLVFASACANLEPNTDEVSFFPLTVDYTEKFSSVGKTLGGFIKREGKPSEREVLMSRLIDRPLRPMFAEGFFNETQVLTYVWSFDKQNMPEPLAMCAASAALVLSDIPLKKAIAGVRVGLVDGNFVVNPKSNEMELSILDLMLAGTEDAITMIEGFCSFLDEEQVLAAIDFGHKYIKKICRALEEWREVVGKEKNLDNIRSLPEGLEGAIESYCKQHIIDAANKSPKNIQEKAFKNLEGVAIEFASSQEKFESVPQWQIKMALKNVKKKIIRNMITTKNSRADGRSTTEIRQISIETGLLPCVHGSVLFTRGETQTLAVCTLGGENMCQKFENINKSGLQQFYLHYSFPPFSVGEVGRMSGPGRREIGHGKLAERSLMPAIPSEDTFPYAIRIESNITESNGSSSMASVCGGCQAMLEAGVPLKDSIAGIAMGLIIDDGNFTILSDISGLEDSIGDMDFKIAGSKNGITAFQMDIKVEGITIEIMRTALMQAKSGRIKILDKMSSSRSEPNALANHAPRIEVIKINVKKIGKLIGPGGSQIKSITEQSGCEISISDDGNIKIISCDNDSAKLARQIIENIIAEPQIGKTYEGVVKSVVNFGAFVEILPGIEGLCHISEFSKTRIENIKDVVNEGEKISVKIIEINDRGQIRLSKNNLSSDANDHKDKDIDNDRKNTNKEPKTAITPKDLCSKILPPPSMEK